MEQETGEKYDLEDFHNVIGPHECGRVVEPSPAVLPQQAKVNTQVHNQEDQKEDPKQCHPDLFRYG
jgi:hypothetical protein